jgi:phospholipid transport system substrate-binding protein
MKRLFSVEFLGLLACLFLALGSPDAAANSADEFIKQHSEAVLKKVLANKASLQGNPAKLYSIIQSDVLPHVDFQAMSQSVLGKHWNSASKTEQSSFINEFRQLLVRTYGTALLSYSGQAIDYKPAALSTDGKYATVQTKVPASGSSPVSIDYRLHSQGSSWKAVDIKVGGVSLVSNYRTNFSTQISQSGIAGLIKQLKEKNAQ